MTNEKSQKLEALDQALKLVNKAFKTETGDQVIAKLSDRPINVKTISSGSLVLDSILGGGLAVGRIIEIYGPESSGKTSFALTAIGNVQKEGGVAAFIDLENALDPRYARKLGVNLDELAVSQPDNAEQALDLVETLAQTGVVDIIVVDSVAALVPKAEVEGTMSDQSMAVVAKLMSKALRKLVRTANQNNCTIIFINQLREKVGVMYGSPEITTGGKALKFFASQRIDVRRREQIKEGKEILGNKVQLKVIKNKVAPPFGIGETVLTFNKGVNKAAEMIETGVEYGVIDLTGRTYTEIETGEVITTQSKAAAISALEENEEMYQRLSKKLSEKLDSSLETDEEA